MKEIRCVGDPPCAPGSGIDRMLAFIEQGKLLAYLQAGILALGLVVALLDGVDLGKGDAVSETEHKRTYVVKRVSMIPEKALEKNEEKAAREGENDELTAEDIRKSYVRYVVSKIEKNKVYPPEEQKAGHEGSVSLRLYVERTGRVRKAVVSRQARYPRLTRSAVESVKRSIPFPAFPRGLPDDEMVINLRIEFFLR